VNSIVLRWLKFNLVGALGIGVQMTAFAALYGGIGVDKLWATALAVETAVVHNFVWHEKFTWKHLSNRTRRDVAMRLVRFHLGNGLVSILGNVALVRLLADGLHLNPYVANLAAIGVCALANFAVSERFVFRTEISLAPTACAEAGSGPRGRYHGTPRREPYAASFAARPAPDSPPPSAALHAPSAES
jgi:putative flippase GtrA